VPPRMVAIKFARQVLPKYVYLNHLKYEVTPYIPKVHSYFSCFKRAILVNLAKASHAVSFAGTIYMRIAPLVQWQMALESILSG